MTSAWRADGESLIADLNDLIQLDRDAIEAYTLAINSVRDAAIRETLAEFRAEHQRRAESLAQAVRARGAHAIELPHITAPFKLAVQAFGSLVGLATRTDASVLLSLRIVEGQIRDKYRQFAAKTWPDELAALIQDSAEREAAHYTWIAEHLRAAGFGEQSLAGSVSNVAEAVHTLVATPIEAAARRVTAFVDRTDTERPTTSRSTEEKPT